MAGNEMGFSLQNWNLVHLGKNNPEHKYKMMRRYLQGSKIKQKKPLGGKQQAENWVSICNVIWQ